MYHWLEQTASELLGANNSDDLEWCLVLAAWFYLLTFGVFTIVLPAPYGKFSEQASSFPLLDKLTGIKISAPLAWCVQELPAFLVPFTAFISVGLDSKTMLLLPFLAHYANRSLLYPMLLNASSRPVPLLTIVNAFLFCLFNGLMQSQVALVASERILTFSSSGNRQHGLLKADSALELARPILVPARNGHQHPLGLSDAGLATSWRNRLQDPAWWPLLLHLSSQLLWRDIGVVRLCCGCSGERFHLEQLI